SHERHRILSREGLENLLTTQYTKLKTKLRQS
ncbi:MAG: hypothetical protein ACI9SP_004748, partial [Arenicella sp.]